MRLTVYIANISAFEVEDEALGNLREYSLANSLYWALAEGHACEQSARRNAMEVSFHKQKILNSTLFFSTMLIKSRRTPPRTLVR